MKKIILACILLCFMFGLCGCSISIGEEKPQQNEQQLQCEHEWVELAWHLEWCSNGDGVSYDIYCPKCQWETKVSYTEWHRIQADMEFKNNQ